MNGDIDMTFVDDGEDTACTIALAFASGSLAGTTRTLDQDQIVLGRRDDCTVSFDPDADRRVSGRHAQIVRRAGRWFIKDLDSRNGTFVNGQRVTEERALNPADTIDLGPRGTEGSVAMNVQLDGAAPPFADKPANGEFPFQCPSCGAAQAASYAEVGTRRLCTACGQSIEVPLPRVSVTNRPQPRAVRPVGPPPPPPPARQGPPPLPPQKGPPPPPPLPRAQADVIEGLGRVKDVVGVFKRKREESQRIKELKSAIPPAKQAAQESCRELAQRIVDLERVSDAGVDESNELMALQNEIIDARERIEKATDELDAKRVTLDDELTEAVRSLEAAKERCADQEREEESARVASEEATAAVRDLLDPIAEKAHAEAEAWSALAGMLTAGPSELDDSDLRAHCEEVRSTTFDGLPDTASSLIEGAKRSEAALAEARTALDDAKKDVGVAETSKGEIAARKQALDGPEGQKDVNEAKRALEAIEQRLPMTLANFGRAIVNANDGVGSDLPEFAKASASLDRLRELKQELASMQ